ncbi:hypothetical protein D3C80_2137170 [compost metagenome]
MHHGTVLDVAVLADIDQLVVAAQHRAEPHTGARLQAYLANQHGIGCGPTGGMALDPQVAQAVFHSRSSGISGDGVCPVQISI